MGRAPCCDKNNVKKGPWSQEEDAKLKSYIEKHGTGGNWIALPHKIGLKRCGKSCRLRWLNYLRPNIKHGGFTEEEDDLICSLYINIGSRWSIIAAQLPGRTDNDIKNYWNTRLKKKLLNKQRCNNKQHKPPLLSETTSSTKKLEINVKACKENHPIFNAPYCFDQQEYYPSQDRYFLTDNPINTPQLESNMPSGHTIYSTNPDIQACDGSISSSFIDSTDFCNMICGDIANNFQEIGEIPNEILMCSTDQKFDGLSDFAAMSNISSDHSWSRSTNNWDVIANSLVNYPNYVLPSYEACNKEAARGWCIDDQFVTL